MQLISEFIKKSFCLVLLFSFLLAVVSPQELRAQTGTQLAIADDSQKALPTVNPPGDEDRDFILDKDFRVEKLAVAGGAEIITIFANLKGLRRNFADAAEEVPLVSVLRDTLGDEKIENDRLRQVWMLTYTKPSLAQKFAAAIPFLYTRTTNKGNARGNPPAIIDIRPLKKDVWNQVFGFVLRNLILDNLGVPVKAVRRQYNSNSKNYRQSSIARALAILALYESVEGEKVLTDSELKDIQARLLVSDKMFGSWMQSENLERVYQANAEKTRAQRGQNWELLRQYAEAEGLYFEPLEMPDGSATHALVWVSQADLATNKHKKFNSRFLNIKNPWADSRLTEWKGYSEVRRHDRENNPASPDSPDAEPKTLIPLALYGLDNPKIPTLLVDFRDRDNPKKRELSRRVLDDLTKSVLSVSKFSNLPYFVGRYLYDFVTGKRGMDVNQASRLRSYSQLKLLLSLNASLDPKFRDEIADRLESVSLNPLENDLEVEVKLARRQYENLMSWAKRPDGLAARLAKDRRTEMTQLKHGGAQQTLYALGRIFSLGLYTHRDKETPELRAAMDARRQLEFHERYLREVARVSAKPEVDADLDAVRRALAFIARDGSAAGAKTARAVARIFSITEDEETRLSALASLYRINQSAAKKELLALYKNPQIDARWRELCARYLKLAVKEEQRISANDVRMITEINEL